MHGLACLLTNDTRGLVGKAERDLAARRRHRHVARGEVIVTDALAAALGANDVERAALDVADPKPYLLTTRFWTFGDVLIMPHNAGHMPENGKRLVDIIAEYVFRLDSSDFRKQVV